MYVANQILWSPLCYEMKEQNKSHLLPSHDELTQVLCESERNDKLKSELSSLLHNLMPPISRFERMLDSVTTILEVAIENLRSIYRASRKK